MYAWITLLLTLSLTSCHSSSSHTQAMWQFFAGRGSSSSHERPLIYRALVPSHWDRCDPLTTESLMDTKTAIGEFYIREGEKSIRLTIHTFPISDLRPPPQAQVARWKKQFQELDELATYVTSDAHGGFSGLYFEGQGIWQDGALRKVMGWSMQLASGYERQLALGHHPLDHLKRADYTIKAVGPIDLIDNYHSEIVTFAHSFEFIEELPFPL